MSDDRIREIEERLAKATPGPWNDKGMPGAYVFAETPPDAGMMVCQIRGWGHLTGRGGGRALSEGEAIAIQTANGRLIAEAPADLRYLLAEIAALRGEVEQLTDLLHPGPLPCGHNSQYAHTEDGGKTINCYVCEVAAMTQERNVANSELAAAGHNIEDVAKELGPLKTALESAEARAVGLERELAEALKWKEPQLARHQPCGCVVCICDDPVKCHGCGAKECGTHPPGEIPNPKYEPHPAIATARREAFKGFSPCGRKC